MSACSCNGHASKRTKIYRNKCRFTSLSLSKKGKIKKCIITALTKIHFIKVKIKAVIGGLSTISIHSENII